jgi:hypothetical protein
MSTARSLRPTDLVALVSLDGRVYPNEARTWERLGCTPEGRSLLESALPPWFSFATGRHTWISIQGQTIQGLISARKRGNRTAWEVECLVAATDEQQVVLDLFDRLSIGVGSAGALKIFLRLEAGSDLLTAARRAGFVPYTNEQLLRADGELTTSELPDGITIRPRAECDGFGLYQLYNASVPEHVRRMEAATLPQWQAAAERRTAGRSKRDLVVLRGDVIVGRLRSCRDGRLGRIDLALHPCLREETAALVALASGGVGNLRPVLCLIPDYSSWLAGGLEASGFRFAGEYVSLVKRTAIPLGSLKPRAIHVPIPRPLAIS